VDTAEKMAVVAFGAITVAAIIIAYRAYSEPSIEEVIREFIGDPSDAIAEEREVTDPPIPTDTPPPVVSD